MGEPLYNYDSVKQALLIIMDEEGIQISRRRITLSTAGVVPRIADVGRDLGVGGADRGRVDSSAQGARVPMVAWASPSATRFPSTVPVPLNHQMGRRARNSRASIKS